VLFSASAIPFFSSDIVLLLTGQTIPCRLVPFFEF
jgi:hypothetical protein